MKRDAVVLVNLDQTKYAFALEKTYFAWKSSGNSCNGAADVSAPDRFSCRHLESHIRDGVV